jgi:RNA polymerase sigma-70 factor (ECF subfamily)
MMNEAEIVAALKSGDPAAVEEVVCLYGDRLLRSAYMLCGNETDAQDLVQDTLILSVRHARRFRRESALYTWLHGILLNLARHHHRKRKRIVYTDQPLKTDAHGEAEPRNLDVETASSALMEGIQRLSAVHREVLILRYYEGMKIEEIARHIGVTKGTVGSRLHYAKRHLRKLVPKELNLFRTHGTHHRRKS